MRRGRTVGAAAPKRPALSVLGCAAAAGLLACVSGCVMDTDVLRMRGMGDGATANPRVLSGAGGGAVATTTRAERARALCFVCREYDDRNGNGVTEASELIGRSERFTTSDNVAFVLKTGISSAFTRTLRLWDGSKTLVYENTKSLEASSAGRYSILQFKPGSLEVGVYEAAWSIDGDEVCSSKFEIVEE